MLLSFLMKQPIWVEGWLWSCHWCHTHQAKIYYRGEFTSQWKVSLPPWLHYNETKSQDSGYSPVLQTSMVWCRQLHLNERCLYFDSSLWHRKEKLASEFSLVRSRQITDFKSGGLSWRCNNNEKQNHLICPTLKAHNYWNPESQDHLTLLKLISICNAKALSWGNTL